MNVNIFLGMKPSREIEKTIKKTKIFKSIVNLFAGKLSKINQKSKAQNFLVSIYILIFVIISGAGYFTFAITYFHTLWYHKVASALSTLIFMFVLSQLIFEFISSKYKKELPQMNRRLSNNFIHTRGSTMRAVKRTQSTAPASTQVFVKRIYDALDSEDIDVEILKTKEDMPSEWLRVLCNLLYFAKKKGEINADEKKVIAKKMKQLTKVMDFANISQGIDNVQFLWVEILLFLAPISVPIMQKVNELLVVDIDMMGIYKQIEAQSTAAMLLLTSNLSALFIHLLRVNKD